MKNDKVNEVSHATCCTPETSTQSQVTATSCCGGPAEQADACCVQDAEAKASGASGCGCIPRETRTAAVACC